MSHRLSRRTAALVAAPVLALGGLTAIGPAPASAVAPDPTPLANGTSWLISQLTRGVIHNNQYDFDDLGLTVDTGLALAELGKTSRVDTISSALAPQVRSYYTYPVTATKTHVSAGSLAKAAAFAQDAGDVARSYGGQNLIKQLEDRVSVDSASAGRIGDVFFPKRAYEADYANTIGQAFAAKALDVANSTLTDSVTNFLLAQQCSAGFFRLDLGATSAATCDSSKGSAANTDATALAVINLQSQTDDTRVQAAVVKAVAWLKRTQAANGSWGGEAPTDAANANSTGLAGWALGEVSATAAATKAAVWLRRHQADDFGPCTTGLTGSTGAIAYDDAALAAGRSDGLRVRAQDQFRRATSQALVALRYAPTGTYASEPTSTSGFVRAGSTQKIYADSVAPGQVVCFARGASQDLVSANRAGNAVGRVKLPAGSGRRVYNVGLTDRSLGKVTFHALGGKTLPIELKTKVPAGNNQVVTVSGLAVGEKVSVFYRGTKVDSGTADTSRTFTARFRVGRELGEQKVRVVGQFADRKVTRTFAVIKGR